MDPAYKKINANELYEKLTKDKISIDSIQRRQEKLTTSIDQNIYSPFKDFSSEVKDMQNIVNIINNTRPKIIHESDNDVSNVSYQMADKLLRKMRSFTSDQRTSEEQKISSDSGKFVITNVVGMGEKESNRIFANICDSVPLATSTVKPVPTPPDFPDQCAPNLITRDFILVIDMIPNPIQAYKFTELESFLKRFGTNLLTNPTNNQIMLIGYDSQNVLKAYSFTNSLQKYFDNLEKLINDTSRATMGHYGRLSSALTYVAEKNIGLRAYTEAFIIIIADHVPADDDTTLNSARLSITRLQRSGFYLSAITPTKGPTAHAFSHLIFNQKWLSKERVTDYSHLPNEGNKFAMQQACSYIEIVPPLGQFTTPARQITTMLSKSKKPSTTNKSITSKSHTKLDEESMIVKLLSNKITNKTADEITESVYNATSIIDTNITVSSLITIIPPSKKIDCMNILIILDRSQSISENDYNQNVRNFVKKLANNIAFEPSSKGDRNRYSRVGVIQFAYSAQNDITLESRSVDEFEKLVDERINYTKSDGTYSGYTNTAAALKMAEKIFFGGYIYENEIEKGAAIILVTDGRHSMFTDDPIPIAQKLREAGTIIICVGLNGTNGDYTTHNREELLKINGNRTDLLFEVYSKNLTNDLSEKIIDNIPCPGDVPGLHRTIPPYYHKFCRSIIFVVETTEIVFSRIISILKATNLIAKYFYALSEHSSFRLITYSNSTNSKIFGERADKYEAYKNIIEQLVTEEHGQYPNIRPLFDGRTFLAQGIKLAKKVVNEFYNDLDNFDGSPLVIFFGQAEKLKIIDKKEAEEEGHKLGKLTSHIHVGDLTVINPDRSIWPAIASTSANIVPLHAFHHQNVKGVADRMIEAVSLSWYNIKCGPPMLIQCPLDMNSMDLIIAVHRTNNSETQNKTNALASLITSGFRTEYDLFHVGLVEYDGKAANILINLKSYDPSSLRKEINKIKPSLNSGEKIQKPLELIYDAYRHGGNISANGIRKFATTTLVFITDTAEDMNIADINAAKELLQKWSKHDCRKSPAMVLIHVGNYSLNKASVDLFGGQISVNEGEFKSWNNINTKNHQSVNAINAAIRNICRQNPTECHDLCDCSNGLPTAFSCRRARDK